MNDKSSIADDVVLGKDVRIFNFVNLYGCAVGDFSKIGSFVEIQKNATVGKHCKISSHTFICEGVHIGDRVFVGHNVTFINDKYPQSVNEQGGLQSEEDWKVIPTHIANDACIGSSSTILCGLTIGERAVVGAGSVVTKNIPPGEVWAGNPAAFIKKQKI